MRFKHFILVILFAVGFTGFLKEISAGDIHEAADSVEKLRKLLAEEPSLLNAKDAGGRTALIWAVMRGNTNSVSFLVSKHADLRAADSGGGTALHYAANACNAQMTRLLLFYDKALAHMQDKEGRTPLHFAARRNFCKDVWRLLLLNGAEVDSLDNKKRTSLHYAAEDGNQGLVEYLLSLHADINARDADGNTPLKLTDKNRSESLQRYLRKHGAQE